MKYIAKYFDSIFFLVNFLNYNDIPRQDIIKISIRQNGFVELVYVGEAEVDE